MRTFTNFHEYFREWVEDEQNTAELLQLLMDSNKSYTAQIALEMILREKRKKNKNQ